MSRKKSFFLDIKAVWRPVAARIKKRGFNPLLLTTLVVVVLTIAGILFFKNFPPQVGQRQIVISSENLQQADTLLIVVKDESAQVSGVLGNVGLHFFRSQNGRDWVAIAGIPVRKNPDTYILVLKDASGSEFYKKDITVSKRNFPVTALAVTPKLAQQGYTSQKIISTIVGQENVSLDAVVNNIGPKSFINKPFIYPLSFIKDVGAFGNIRSDGISKIQHLGVDLDAPMDTPVYAVNDGVVVFEQSLPDYGNTLAIDHGLGVYSLYLHLASFTVTNGQKVAQKDFIGLSGDTGYAIEPHLHFSIKIRGAAIDPLIFIKTTRQTDW